MLNKINLLKKNKKSDSEVRVASLKQNQSVILNDKTAFIIQEAYKTARTNIIFSVAGAADNGCKVIAISSANPGEGKTTTCINLAITFAQTGAKVLLIDGDLRKPRAHQYLGVTKTSGLSTVLSKQQTFEDVVYKDVKDGLDLLASGSIPPNPAELLSSDAMGVLIENLKEKYDYIFFDTPPITVVTDAVALSKYVDGLVIVVREGYTNHESIERTINLLNIAEAKILGFFVNDVETSNANYGAYRSKGYGGKRYGYGYGYGYAYKNQYSYRYGGNEHYGDRVETEDINADKSMVNDDLQTEQDDLNKS